MIEIECLWECDDGLGESPIWVEEEHALYWSDHVGPAIDLGNGRRPSIRRFDVGTKETASWEMPEQVGSFAFRSKGGIIAGTNSGFVGIDLDERHYERLVDVEIGRHHLRLNDGKIDRRGRYWCGTMDSRLKNKSGRLYRLDPDRSCRAVVDDFQFICSNGIAFSPDDKRMYFGDTKGGMIYVFDFDLDDGELSNRHEFHSLKDRERAIVDGATVDTDGCYWFALNLGGKIIRLDPKGRVDREITMPIPSPTCVTFGGDDHRTLYVTSQQAFVTDEELARHPRPGSLFAIHGLGVQGLPEPRFAG
ncbi:L-arabinolactonase [Planctomycetes bacterium Pan216]|uniref:L-arabinolactonase n=1 Tax=Kolteria novifilia TaxID=2527975 RepID=A0A518B3R0_9BACT|nr:L-arabinolactonase [Planctomycetes bacterium Pan216]